MNETLINFINDNSKNQWQYPDSMPDNLWESDWPWAPIIPEQVDLSVIKDEMKKIDHLFVEHRAKDKINSYGHDGWFSLTLHGIAHDKTENYDRYGFKTEAEAKYHWTECCELIPETIKFIKSLPFYNYGRVRIMRLSPGGYIMPHSDGPGRIFGPFNFALTNPEGCKFVFKDIGIVPFKPGMGFLLDIGRPHALFNDSDEYRYHVIVHGIPDNTINQRVKLATQL